MSLLVPKKDGGPNVEFFQSSESIQGFEQIRQWLHKTNKKYVQTDAPTKETLSQLLISFIQYQETRFGKGAVEPPTTRLPMRCFLDFKPGGSLCQIFSNMYRYKYEQRWKKFEFNVTKTARKDKDPYIQMVMDIVESLITAECFRLPVAYIRPEVEDEIREQITEILKDRQGTITEDEDEATHIIYPEAEQSPDDYGRPSFKRGKNVMLHWYYLPDSYDTWTPITFDLPDDVPESPVSPPDVWRVSAGWVLHSHEYNEWMSEEDYEVDESGKKKVHRHRLLVEDLMQDEKRTGKAGGKQKRKRSPSPAPKGVGKRKSGRSPAVVQKRARGNADIEDEEDLTRDMEDPTPEPNVTEVKPSTNSPATQTNSKQRSVTDIDSTDSGGPVPVGSGDIVHMPINDADIAYIYLYGYVKEMFGETDDQTAVVEYIDSGPNGLFINSGNFVPNDLTKTFRTDFPCHDKNCAQTCRSINEMLNHFIAFPDHLGNLLP